MRASSIDDNAAVAEKMSGQVRMYFENGVPDRVKLRGEIK